MHSLTYVIPLVVIPRVYESRTRGGGGGEYRTCYKYGANRWESNVTFGVLHVRLTRAHVRKTAAARAAAVLPVVYTAYTVHFRRSTRLSSRVSHVTFPTVVTVSIVRCSILFVLYELLVILTLCMLFPMCYTFSETVCWQWLGTIILAR